MSNKTKRLDEYISGVEALGKESPDAFHAFMAAFDAVFAEGALDSKTKRLIAIALCTQSRCKHDAARHVSEAIKVGASRREIVEAAMVAVALGSCLALDCAATALKETLDEFGAI